MPHSFALAAADRIRGAGRRRRNWWEFQGTSLKRWIRFPSSESILVNKG